MSVFKINCSSLYKFKKYEELFRKREIDRSYVVSFQVSVHMHVFFFVSYIVFHFVPCIFRFFFHGHIFCESINFCAIS